MKEFVPFFDLLLLAMKKDLSFDKGVLFFLQEA